MPPRVKWADDTLLVTECRDLMIGLFDRIQIPGVSGSSQLQGFVDWIEVDSARVEAYRPLGGPVSAPVLPIWFEIHT